MRASGIFAGRRLARNTIWNLVGQAAPLLVGVVAIPRLVHGLGVDRFGVLGLVWAVIGYFSLFDLGLSRAITKIVAEKLGGDEEAEVPGVIWTGLTLGMLAGSVGALVAASLSYWIVDGVLNVPAPIAAESKRAFLLLSVSIPIVIVNVGLRGVLEAYQRFAEINWVRVPSGMYTFLAPLAVLPFTSDLATIVLALLLGRCASMGAYWVFSLRVVPGLRRIRVERAKAKELMSFGGWIAVSNFVGPLFFYLDRFVIGSLISVAAVTMYVAPYEVVTKLLMIPGATMGVFFPALSAAFRQDRARVARLLRWSLLSIVAMLAPLVLAMVVFAADGLRLWLGAEYAEQGTIVVQLLAIGALVNALGLVFQATVQASGRPDLTAKLHMLELPLYVAYLFAFVSMWGIKGAALAWLVRVSISMVALLVMSSRLLTRDRVLPAY